MHLNGAHLTENDTPRLAQQIQRVLDVLQRGRHVQECRPWLTVSEIGAIINYGEYPYAPATSISAQIRNLRKEKHGWYIIDERYREGTRVAEYRLVGQRTVTVEQGNLGL